MFVDFITRPLPWSCVFLFASLLSHVFQAAAKANKNEMTFKTIWKFSRKVLNIANLNCVKRVFLFVVVFGVVKTEILCSTKMHMIWNDVCLSCSLMAQLNWHKFYARRRFRNNKNNNNNISIKIRIICYFACEQHWQWTHFVFTICCFFLPIRFISLFMPYSPGTTTDMHLLEIWTLCCVVKTDLEIWRTIEFSKKKKNI